jgi:hypothetical protein
MQTKKLALLSTMLVGLAVPAFAADTANQSANSASQQVQQQADAAADATWDVGTEAERKVQDAASDATQPADASQDTGSDATQPADASQDTASDATQPADASQDTASGTSEGDGGVLLVRAISVGTSDQPYQGEVLGGMTAEEIIGMPVVGRDNEEVGEVTDLLIGEDGTVDRVIVDAGGFLGFGDKSVALDIASLSLGEGDGELVSDLDAETVEDMPEWQQDDEGWYSE